MRPSTTHSRESTDEFGRWRQARRAAIGKSPLACAQRIDNRVEVVA